MSYAHNWLKSSGLGKLIICVGAVTVLAGCKTTESVLSGVDAGCAEIDYITPITGSRITGRAIKIPEGSELTAETIAELCE